MESLPIFIEKTGQNLEKPSLDEETAGGSISINITYEVMPVIFSDLRLVSWHFLTNGGLTKQNQFVKTSKNLCMMAN